MATLLNDNPANVHPRIQMKFKKGLNLILRMNSEIRTHIENSGPAICGTAGKKEF